MEYGIPIDSSVSQSLHLITRNSEMFVMHTPLGKNNHFSLKYLLSDKPQYLIYLGTYKSCATVNKNECREISSFIHTKASHKFFI